MTVVFLTGLSIRLYNLGGQTLECDELYTLPAATGHQYVYLSQEGESEANSPPQTTKEYRKLLTSDTNLGLTAVTAVLKRNVHLPAYFFFMHYWVHWTGNPEWMLRLPSAALGAFAVLMLFFLGKELLGTFTGFISALLMALSPEQIYFSQQARMYSLLALLAVSSTYVLVLLKRQRARPRLYLIYGLISVIGLYAHYEYAFFLTAQVVYVWLASRSGRDNARVSVITHIAILLAFLPWVVITAAQKANSPEVIAWVNGSLTSNLILVEIVTKISRLVSVPELPLGWLSVIVAYALIIYGAVRLNFRNETLYLLLLWIALPIAGIILMDRLLGTRAVTITRYWLIIGPPLLLLLAYGLAQLKKPALRIGLTAILVGFMFSAALLTARGELRPKPDHHKELALYVDSEIERDPNQSVIAEGLNSLPLALAYYGKDDFEVLRFKWMIDQLKQRSFMEVVGNRNRVLLLVSGPSQAVRLLNENGFQAEAQPLLYGHVNVVKFVQRR